jgi:hypothetical protein
MNFQPAAKRRRLAEKHVPSGDNFRKMQLRTVIRENHGQAIEKVAFNNTTVAEEDNSLNCNNLVASIGANQLNIYDNIHCDKNFLDLFCNFVHKVPKENLADVDPGEEHHTPGADLTCVTWVHKPAPENTNLAVGTKDGAILILSIASSSVTHVLKGHSSEVTHVVPIHVKSATGEQGLLSSSRDGQIKFWNVTTGRCVSTYKAVDGKLANACESIGLVVETDTTFLTSQPDGSVRRWVLDAAEFDTPVAAVPLTNTTSSSSSSSTTTTTTTTSTTPSTSTSTSNKTNTAIHVLSESTCVISSPKPRPLSHFSSGENGALITGSNTGRISVWEKKTEDSKEYKCVTTFTVPRGEEGSSNNNAKSRKKKVSSASSSSVSTSKYGTKGRNYAFACANEYVITGNESGEIIVYNGRTGSQVSKLSHSRMNARSGSIEDVDVSKDGTTILVSTSSGLLFRWSCLPVWEGEEALSIVAATAE